MVSCLGWRLLVGTCLPDDSQVEAPSRPESHQVIRRSSTSPVIPRPLSLRTLLDSRFTEQSASKQFNNEVLRAHNEYRQQHGVPPLKLCKKLNQEAQQYSEALASTRILKHSPESSRGQCGENLAWASYDQPGQEVADRWYSEIKNYNFQQPGFTSGTGHFTAMVWKNTKKMGVGKASASDGSSFVVARYFPAGNVVNQGYFEENVLPPKK
ncbi:PREDICTED: Golgi-associated plant pathogenesis-related protein 1 [Myotis brandtii]|uniref:Golgi-associated plant pathogenesis-related protein 1 n=1 Tax=Myotis brandtii TaxID=109478 RepID=UPI0007046560|nr:PREDICTED: Golgi-associated plant pathogenesis-related protein 1 [Myotis brandtii]